MAQKKDFQQIKTILTIALLVLGYFISPLLGYVGVVLMWMWMKWNKWIKVVLTIPSALIIISTLGILAYIGIGQPVTIKGDAMSPNLTNGQYYMTNAISDNKPVGRGDVVIYRSPENAEIDRVQRIVGLPYEKILIQDGKVHISGEPLDESKYLLHGVTTETFKDGVVVEGQEYTVPANGYFLLGDNRPRSADSRVWGAITASQIKSKLGFCYWRCGK